MTRPVIVQQFGVSLDGFSATEDGQGWTRWAALDDPELDARIVENVRRAGTHVMGRETYLGHAAYWPGALSAEDPSERAIAEVLDAADKVAFSRSLTGPTWAGTRIAGGDTEEELDRLRAEPGGEILAVGGVTFLRSLVQRRAFDTVRLYVLPYVAGRGASIFDGVDGAIDLRLVSSQPFPSGVTEVVYDRVR